MFRLCHFLTFSFLKVYFIFKDKRYISFSKINRLQGLRGLQMFRLCHFSKDISFSKINWLQGLRGLQMFRLCHFSKYMSFSKIKDIYNFRR